MSSLLSFLKILVLEYLLDSIRVLSNSRNHAQKVAGSESSLVNTTWFNSSIVKLCIVAKFPNLWRSKPFDFINLLQPPIIINFLISNISIINQALSGCRKLCVRKHSICVDRSSLHTSALSNINLSTTKRSFPFFELILQVCTWNLILVLALCRNLLYTLNCSLNLWLELIT